MRKIKRYRSQQEIWDAFWKIWGDPNTRPKRASGGDGGCVYDPNVNGGFGCAIGSLLPPKTAASWARRGFSYITRVAHDHPQTYRRHFRKADLSLLQELQRWHDRTLDAGTPRVIEEQLQEIADKYNLQIPAAA